MKALHYCWLFLFISSFSAFINAASTAAGHHTHIDGYLWFCHIIVVGQLRMKHSQKIPSSVCLLVPLVAS